MAYTRRGGAGGWDVKFDTRELKANATRLLKKINEDAANGMKKVPKTLAEGILDFAKRLIKNRAYYTGTLYRSGFVREEEDNGASVVFSPTKLEQWINLSLKKTGGQDKYARPTGMEEDESYAGEIEQRSRFLRDAIKMYGQLHNEISLNIAGINVPVALLDAYEEMIESVDEQLDFYGITSSDERRRIGAAHRRALRQGRNFAQKKVALGEKITKLRKRAEAGASKASIKKRTHSRLGRNIEIWRISNF